MHEKKNHKSTIIALTTLKGNISNSGFNSIMMYYCVKDRCPTIKHCETCAKFIITADWQPEKKKNDWINYGNPWMQVEQEPQEK